MKFRAGELVSIGPINGVTIRGRVLQLTPRMLKISIENGPRAGQLDWASAPWKPGVGAHESRCQECDRVFKTDHAGDRFCPSCEAGDESEIRAQGENPSRRSTSWELYERERRARSAK